MTCIILVYKLLLQNKINRCKKKTFKFKINIQLNEEPQKSQ